MTDIVKYGTLAIDRRLGNVYLDGEPIVLTMTQYRLLLALADRYGEVVSRQWLLDCVWDGCAEIGTVDVYIKSLRDKLGEKARSPRFIRNVRGLGYQLIDLEAR
jgi:two-component system, OmpR family, alkaline phosphatase synthesis response regulator PhoP